MRDSDWLLIRTLSHSKNLSAAAEQLYVTQPALSKQLTRIEREFGVTIAIRTPRGITLTEDGEYLATKAEEILALVRETHDHFADSSQAVLLVGSSNTYARFTLLEHLKTYQKRYPEAMLFLTCAVSDQVLKLVESHSVNIGFVRGEHKHNLEQFLLSRDRGWIVTNRTVTMDELSAMPFIQHSRDSYTAQLTQQWWAAYFGAPLSIGMQVNDTTTCLELIKQGMGFGIFFNDYLREAKDFFHLPMENHEGKTVERSTFMVYPKTEIKRPDSRRFISFIEDIYRG